jgi:hypothetical protein
VDSKAIRMIVVVGLVGTLLLAVLMMFSLDQVADTQTPEIAKDLAREYVRALQPEGDAPPLKLSMAREGKGASARRVYTLRIRPSDAVAAEPPSVSRLMHQVARDCAGAVGKAPGEVWIRCVAALPDGTEKEAVWQRDLEGRETGEILRAAPALPPPPAPEETARAETTTR